MNRREMLKLSLLSGGAVLLSANNSRAMADSLPTGGSVEPASPPIMNQFALELPRMATKAALPGGVNDLSLPANGGFAPNGTVYPQITGHDLRTTYPNSLERIVATQQRIAQFPPQLFYVLNVRQARHVFHPDPPYSNNGGSIIWGYDGRFPGPTFMSRYGVPILVRIINRLVEDPAANPQTADMVTPRSYGDPRISTHLHNGHTASESDGNPFDIYPPLPPPSPLPPYPASIQDLWFRDHHYVMFRAGLPAPNANDGDPRETVSTLWYHDHSMDHTAENVYKGLVGFHLFFDEVDSGNENDPDPRALRLPSGDFDVPLLFQDKRFDSNGQLLLDPAAQPIEGFLGDRFTVNGVIQPKLPVLRRKYRFRLLNAGPSRFYQFFLTKKDVHTNNDVDQPFKQIGNDESLLEHPLGVTSVLLSVAERADVIIDFGHYNQGERLFLVNRLVMQDNGQGPKVDADLNRIILPVGRGDQILRFDVGGNAADPSRVLDDLRANPALPDYITSILLLPFPDNRDRLRELPNHRWFRFNRFPPNVGPWVINQESFDNHPHGGLPRHPGGGRPDGEVWTIKNMDTKWSHPIHIHLEEFRILLRNGKVPGSPGSTEQSKTEQSRKDVLLVGPDEEVQIFLRFRDFLGKYPIHCHNVIHEDHAMMMRYDVMGASR